MSASPVVADKWNSTASLAMLVFDLDHLKQINDQLGRGRGDEIMAAVSAPLRGTVRESDFVARY